MNANFALSVPAPAPDDPAELGWPATLPIEIALKTASIPEICKAYNLDRDDWARLRLDPGFIAEVAGCMEALKKEGVSFKMKARLQAEELLKSSWKMIHDTVNTPAAVRADLIKFTIKAAGLSEETKLSGGQTNALSIQINLG